MKRTAETVEEPTTVAPKATQTVTEEMLAEALNTFDMFRKDEATLTQAIKDRNEQIELLKQEQSQDIERLLRVRGALSALQHLVTVYKDKMQRALEARGE